MPTQTTAAKRKAAQAAVQSNGHKTVDFRGLKLKLPPECPGEVLFDIGDDNISQTLRTLLGNAQYTEVREKVKGDKLSLNETVDVLTEFLNGIFSDTYGITAGE